MRVYMYMYTIYIYINSTICVLEFVNKNLRRNNILANWQQHNTDGVQCARASVIQSIRTHGPWTALLDFSIFSLWCASQGMSLCENLIRVHFASVTESLCHPLRHSANCSHMHRTSARMPLWASAAPNTSTYIFRLFIYFREYIFFFCSASIK